MGLEIGENLSIIQQAENRIIFLFLLGLTIALILFINIKVLSNAKLKIIASVLFVCIYIIIYIFYLSNSNKINDTIEETRNFIRYHKNLELSFSDIKKMPKTKENELVEIIVSQEGDNRKYPIYYQLTENEIMFYIKKKNNEGQEVYIPY